MTGQSIELLDEYKQEQAEVQMMIVDALPAEHRALIHEFGYSIVVALMAEGVRDAPTLSAILRQRREMMCRHAR